MTELNHNYFLKQIQHTEGDSLHMVQTVYADWLSERGDVRGTLMQLGVGLWNLEGYFQSTFFVVPQQENDLPSQYLQLVKDLSCGYNGKNYEWRFIARLPCVSLYVYGSYWYIYQLEARSDIFDAILEKISLE